MEGKENSSPPARKTSTEKISEHSLGENSISVRQKICGSSKKARNHSKKLVRRAKLSLQKKCKESKCFSRLPVNTQDLDDSDDFKSVYPHKEKSLPQCSLGAAEEENPLPSVSVEESELQEASLWQCPTCRLQLELSDLEKKLHLTACLQQRFAHKSAKMSSGFEGTDEELAQDLARREREKVEEERRTEEECYFCQMCHKDLSHMNSTCRAQHVNRCMDEEAAKSRLLREAEEELEKAKTAVLDCPMCGKPLKTGTMRRSHLKRCAQELQVPTERLLSLVAAQEAERQAQVAAGFLPPSIAPARSLKRAARDSSSSDSRKPPAKKSKRAVDEETQLAMALSHSLAAQEDRQQQQLQPCSTHGASSAQAREGGGRQQRRRRQRAEG